VESSESGAHISINGRSSISWVTPHLFSLVNGLYNIQVIKAGYKSWTKQVRVSGPQEKWVMATLQAIDSAGDDGVFAVETDPPGMQVYVDGKLYGTSRVEKALPVGWHVCEVRASPGSRPLVMRFHLNSGDILTRRIRLKPWSVSAGATEVSADAWNRSRTN
jgi:hypothetical protein